MLIVFLTESVFPLGMEKLSIHKPLLFFPSTSRVVSLTGLCWEQTAPGLSPCRRSWLQALQLREPWVWYDVRTGARLSLSLPLDLIVHSLTLRHARCTLQTSLNCYSLHKSSYLEQKKPDMQSRSSFISGSYQGFFLFSTFLSQIDGPFFILYPSQNKNVQAALNVFAPRLLLWSHSMQLLQQVTIINLSSGNCD